MHAPIRVALIGCGEIGEIYASVLREFQEVALVAYCDLREDKAAALCNKGVGGYWTNEPGRIMKDDGIDAVYILTHHDTHASLAVAAARAGKHVMLEKPLALTMRDCDTIADAVEKSGIKLMTAFKLRYYPSVRKLKSLIPKPIVSIGQMMDQRWPDVFWANDPRRGGGNVLSQGCHTMDLLYFLNVSEPVRIYAEGGNLTHAGLDIFDNMVATIQFENGAIASVVQGDAGATPFVSKFSFQVLDGVKTAHLYDRLKKMTYFDGQETTLYSGFEETGIVEENRDFIQSLLMDTPPPTTHIDGVRATKLVLKAFAALRSGKPQTL